MDITMILGIVLGVISLALVAIVMAQPGKDKRLSGAIAGGSETYFGKSKSAGKEKILNRVTVVLCILLFAVLLTMLCITGKPEAAALAA